MLFKARQLHAHNSRSTSRYYFESETTVDALHVEDLCKATSRLLSACVEQVVVGIKDVDRYCTVRVSY